MPKLTFLGIPSLFSISDEQAMWRVQNQDDHSAFTLLVERWEDRIRQLCFRVVGNAHSAEDLTQEAFVRLFAKRRDYDPERRFSTYLWRIALNLCYDELRRVTRRGESALDSDSDGVFSAAEEHFMEVKTPAARLVESEESQLVRSAVMHLPEIYRTVLVLRHYENLKLREIADVLDIPEGTVNSRMAEALVQLTRLLEPRLQERKAARPKTTRPTNRQELLVV
jgi:RNA polymerase sigma-70 factor (ECF subfamily)